MNTPNRGQELKVFISYSRRDSTEFADELVAGLQVAGFAPFLDRHDIAAVSRARDPVGVTRPDELAALAG